MGALYAELPALAAIDPGSLHESLSEAADVAPVVEAPASLVTVTSDQPSPRSAHRARLVRAALEIEGETAQDAGELGLYPWVLAQVSLPRSRPETASLERQAGKLSLSMLAAPRIGLPYGRLPRLLMCWTATEAVRTRSRRLDLGPSLSSFMRLLGLVPTGGRWGTIAPLRDQARRLYNATIAVHFDDPAGEGFEDVGYRVAHRTALWWSASSPDQVGLFGSFVELSQEFYELVVSRPVPIDTRALRALRAPLSIDLLVWASWRSSFLRQAVEIPWRSLSLQLGSEYAHPRQFRAAVLARLRQVVLLYPDLRVSEGERGLILRPCPPHVARRSR